MTVQEPIQVGEWTVTPSRNLIQRADSAVQIEPKVMDLLICLARRAGQVVPIDVLIEEVWAGVVVSDGSVYLLINRLRQVLDDDQHRQIETIRKRGYRLTVPVLWNGPDDEQAAAKRIANNQADSTQEQRATNPRLALFGSLALFGAVAVAWVFFDRAGTSESPAAGGQDSFGRAADQGVPLEVSPEVRRAVFQILTLTTLEEALSLLDGTPEIDTGSALAKGLRAFLYSMSLTTTYMAESVDVGAISETRALIERHANDALMLDADVVMAHLALGNMYFFDWRWSAAEASFERALAASGGRVDPGFASFVMLNSYSGNHERAIALSRAMIAANPESIQFNGFLGLALANSGQNEAAVMELEFILEAMPQFYPGRVALVNTYLALGIRSDAMRHAEALNDRPYLMLLLGRDEVAAREATRLLERASAGAITMSAGQRAKAHLALGDKESALAWLEIAADKSSRHEPDADFFDLMDLKMNIAGYETLNEPAFASVLARIVGD